ncbi:MAG: CinA family protein [Agarilytica sp.]
MQMSIPSLSKTLGNLLFQQRLTITCAESCTGGGVASAITETPGSSAWFNAGVVAYSNDMKQALLGVSERTLSEFGAVSEEVVCEMAIGARDRTRASIGVSTSGVAGPSGGSAEKPIGMVCFGLVVGNKVSASTEYFSGERAEVRSQSVAHALQLVIRALENKSTV